MKELDYAGRGDEEKRASENYMMVQDPSPRALVLGMPISEKVCGPLDAVASGADAGKEAEEGEMGKASGWYTSWRVKRCGWHCCCCCCWGEGGRE